MKLASPIALLRHARRLCLCLTLFGGLAVLPAPATADILTVLHTFDFVNGASPIGRLIQGSDGRFYGATLAGGPQNFGTLYAVSAAGDFELLHSFSGPDGTSPQGGLVEVGSGTFYGVTYVGYRFDNGTQTRFEGTVFRLSAAGALQTLHTFEAAPDAGAGPGPLVDGRDGWLYGTTFSGGSHGRGTVFKVAPDGTFVTLHHFTAAEGRARPISG